jgi:transposase-like protein
VERPPYEQLVEEIRAMGFSAVGRRYGVTDNAIRTWVRAYERAMSFSPSTDTTGGRTPAPPAAAARPTDIRGEAHR